jgi:hypothetical protein
MPIEVPKATVLQYYIKEPFAQLNPTSETRHLNEACLPAFKSARADDVFDIRESRVRKYLQGRRHLKRIKGWPRRQHAYRTGAFIAKGLQRSNGVGVVPTPRVAKHFHFFSE